MLFNFISNMYITDLVIYITYCVWYDSAEMSIHEVNQKQNQNYIV